MSGRGGTSSGSGCRSTAETGDDAEALDNMGDEIDEWHAYGGVLLVGCDLEVLMLRTWTLLRLLRYEFGVLGDVYFDLTLTAEAGLQLPSHRGCSRDQQKESVLVSTSGCW
jgi:hypothetical protein